MIQSGEAEFAKGLIHFIVGGLAAAMCLYSVVAWGTRRSMHLVVNIIVYFALWGWEAFQTWHHWQRG